MSFEEVEDQLTLIRYSYLSKHWAKWPPVSVTAALYTGYHKARKEQEGKGVDVADTASNELSDDDAAYLFQMFGMPPQLMKGKDDGED